MGIPGHLDAPNANCLCRANGVGEQCAADSSSRPVWVDEEVDELKMSVVNRGSGEAEHPTALVGRDPHPAIGEPRGCELKRFWVARRFFLSSGFDSDARRTTPSRAGSSSTAASRTTRGPLTSRWLALGTVQFGRASQSHDGRWPRRYAHRVAPRAALSSTALGPLFHIVASRCRTGNRRAVTLRCSLACRCSTRRGRHGQPARRHNRPGGSCSALRACC
jgi:hypothetical protein